MFIRTNIRQGYSMIISRECYKTTPITPFPSFKKLKGLNQNKQQDQLNQEVEVIYGSVFQHLLLTVNLILQKAIWLLKAGYQKNNFYNITISLQNMLLNE